MKPVFKHITVPVDGSTTSARGIAFALELAREGGRVSFCSVVDPVLMYAPAMQGAAMDPGPMLEVLDGCFAELIAIPADNAWVTAVNWVPGQPGAIHHLGGMATGGDIAVALGGPKGGRR